MTFLLTNTAIAALLALAVLLVGKLLRPAPAAMHVLWLFVLLKLALPPLFELPIELPWSAPAAAPPVLVLDATAVPLTSPAPAPYTSFELSWSDLLLGSWGLGTAVLIALLAASIVHGHRRVRRLGPAPAWLRREVEAMAQRLQVEVPALCDDPHGHAPCIWSLFGTRLLLPAAVLASKSDKGRAAVIAHELAHLRRGDHLVAHLELLLAVLLWWHPLFWFARARLRLWAELACDAWAIASVPDAQLDYAGVLIDAVATPDSAVPGLTVLAARPAARAAFERRLTMILNENVACRASRGWWLPFAAMGLGLLAAPVAAQKPEPKPRIEVKVNGQDLDELSPADRRAVLKQLLQQSERDAQGDDDETPQPRGKRQKSKQQKPKQAPMQLRVQKDADAGGSIEIEGLPDLQDLPRLVDLPDLQHLQGLLQQGLQQARVEILGDADLKQLGIQDEVAHLIDSIGNGKGFDGALDQVIKAAIQGAGKQAVLEIRGDQDLQQLGIGADVEQLIGKILNDEDTQQLLSNLARKVAESALQDIKVEVLDDADLKRLGIDVDLGHLLDGKLFDGKILDGHDGNGSLQQLIDQAIRAATHGESQDEDGDRQDQRPKAKKAKKTKKAKNTKIV